MYFSKGNRKLSKGVLIWNLPRLTTCPGAGACKDWCYEIKIERMYKGSRPCREQNFKDSKRKDFVDRVVGYLNGRKEKIVRIHEAGDLYSQTYLNKWIEVSEGCQDKVLYTYTKSHHLNFSKVPPNFVVLHSFGSRFDEKINYKKDNTARVIVGKGSLKEHLCPGQGCGDQCIFCMDIRSGIKHVSFRKH